MHYINATHIHAHISVHSQQRCTLYPGLKKKCFPVTRSVYRRCCGNSCQSWPLRVCHSQHGGADPGTRQGLHMYVCVCVCSRIAIPKLPVWLQVYNGVHSPALLASLSSNISFHQSFTLSRQWAPSLLLLKSSQFIYGAILDTAQSTLLQSSFREK